MFLMPLDLRHQRFRKIVRGYDPQEVTAFLNQAADAYEQARRELDQSRQELAQLRLTLSEYQERETTLKNTLLTAQRMADQIHETAQQEARVILREAEARANLVLAKAQARIEESERDINELRLRRRDVETSLEAIISGLDNALKFIREQDRQDREEKLLLHRPRQADAQQPPAAAPAESPAAASPEPQAQQT
jgi:cell division initiation protein